MLHVHIFKYHRISTTYCEHRMKCLLGDIHAILKNKVFQFYLYCNYTRKNSKKKSPTVSHSLNSTKCSNPTEPMITGGAMQ